MSKTWLQQVFSAFIFLSLSLFALIVAPKAEAFSGSGGGTSGNPYLITSCAQLQEIDDDLDAYYRQTQNVNCNGFSFEPIGRISPFTGTLDGAGFEINNLTITGGSNEDIALIVDARNGAVIDDVHLDGGTLTGIDTAYVASFISSVNGGSVTIRDSSSNLTVNSEIAAGLVALANLGDVTIERSSFTGNITNTWTYTGGLIGVALSGDAYISDSYTSGTYIGEDYVGGLVGYFNEGSIARSYSVANITADGGDRAGGLLGHKGNVTITDSFFAGSITGTSTNIGAVFGYATGSYSSVYFDEYLAGLSDCAAIGGATCNAVNVGNATPNYFKNNNTNTPLNAWNFSGVWLTTASYPIHGVATVDEDDSGSNSSSGSSPNQPLPWTCQLSAPSSAPDLFQINTTSTEATLYFAPAGNSDRYFISYGYLPGDQRFGVEFPVSANDGVIAFTIQLLSPRTTYYFTVRGGHDCMPGAWSNTLRARTTGTSQAVFYK